MARLARTHQGDRVLLGGDTLLASCLDAGIPIASACSGRGACGRCLVTVLRGAERLDPRTPRETALLEKLEAGQDQRLACQCPLPAEASELVITAGYW